MSRTRHERILEPFAGLLGEVPGTSRAFEFDAIELPIADDLAIAGPIGGTGRVVRTNRGLLVELRATTVVAETCSRCLEATSVPIEVVVEEEVLPSLDLSTGQPLDAGAEPDVVRLDDHHRLDLGALLRDAVSLAQPIAVLCRPDCPGLCPTCGGRLADPGDHEHGDEDIDPRLAGLRAFTVDGSSETG